MFEEPVGRRRRWHELISPRLGGVPLCSPVDDLFLLRHCEFVDELLDLQSRDWVERRARLVEQDDLRASMLPDRADSPALWQKSCHVMREADAFRGLRWVLLWRVAATVSPPPATLMSRFDCVAVATARAKVVLA